MTHAKRALMFGMIGTLLVTSLLLLPAAPALAKPHFSFGLNLGVPVAPYPVYGYPYAYPPATHYPSARYQLVYPPCARVWTPGYYDGYGNWVFGYYRYECAPYGYGY